MTDPMLHTDFLAQAGDSISIVIAEIFLSDDSVDDLGGVREIDL
jgi:hypothetical protein